MKKSEKRELIKVLENLLREITSLTGNPRIRQLVQASKFKISSLLKHKMTSTRVDRASILPHSV